MPHVMLHVEVGECLNQLKLCNNYATVELWGFLYSIRKPDRCSVAWWNVCRFRFGDVRHTKNPKGGSIPHVWYLRARPNVPPSATRVSGHCFRECVVQVGARAVQIDTVWMYVEDSHLRVRGCKRTVRVQASCPRNPRRGYQTHELATRKS